MKTTIQKYISDPQTLKDNLGLEFPGWDIKYSKFSDQITMSKAMQQHVLLINKNDVVIESSFNRASRWYGIPAVLVAIIFISIDNYLNPQNGLTNWFVWVCISLLVIELGYYLFFRSKVEGGLEETQKHIELIVSKI